MALTKPRAYQIFDLDYKQSVRVLTATDITLSGGAPDTVDNIPLQAGDRVLVKGQSTGSQNGLYKVQTLGTGANGTWIRTIDGDQTGEIQAGMIVMVTEGNVYKDTQWKLITNDPITIGVTALVFELNTSTSSISSGNSSIAINELGGNAVVTIGNVGNVAVFSSTGLTASSITTSGNALIGGDLVINGNLTYVNITDLNIEDPIIGLGRGANNTPLTTNDGKDRGEQLWYYTSSEQSAFFGYDNSAGKLVAAGNVDITNEIVTVNNYGSILVGNVEATGNINPTANITYDLGSTNLRWKDLWLSNSSIYIGDAIIGATGNTLTINGANVLTGNAGSTFSTTGNIVGANILTGGLVSATGNVTGNYFIGNGSQLTSLTGSNITGAVANATYATTAGSAETSNTANTATTSATVTGNAQANITSVGILSSLSVGGNITGNYFIGDGSNISNLQAGNIVGTVANATYATTAGSAETANSANTANTANSATVAGTVTSNAQANITSVGVLSSLSVSGNITGNYFIGNGSQLTGLPEQYGNANVASYLPTYTGNLTANVFSASGNVTGSNILTAGIISTSGNIFGGNISVADVQAANINGLSVSAIGTIIGNYYYGDGGGLSGLQAANIVGAVANASYADTANTASLATIAGTVTSNAQANITSVGVLSSLSVSGNIVPGNVTGAATVAATNLTGTLTTGAQTNISLVGTLSSLSVLGNVQAGNLRTIGETSTTGNVSGGNILTTGVVSATGNVIGSYIIGNGSQLTGLPEQYGNANVAAYLPTYTGNLTANTISASGNVTGNYFIGDGSQLTGIGAGGNILVLTRSSGIINIPIIAGYMTILGRSGNISVPVIA